MNYISFTNSGTEVLCDVLFSLFWLFSFLIVFSSLKLSPLNLSLYSRPYVFDFRWVPLSRLLHHSWLRATSKAEMIEFGQIFCFSVRYVYFSTQLELGFLVWLALANVKYDQLDTIHIGDKGSRTTLGFYYFIFPQLPENSSADAEIP